MSVTVKNKIKTFQAQLGVKDDGAWGGVSQETLEKSNLRITLTDSFIEKLLNIKSSIPRDKRRESIKHILDTCNDMVFGKNINGYDNKSAKNPLYVAYILATAYHETAFTIYPISEIGKGRTRKYGKVFKNSKGLRYGIKNSKGEAYDYEMYPYTYYGRGLVQLTWWDNYSTMSPICGIDLVSNPEEANNPKYASKILVYGMIKGSFTGAKLSSYIKYGLQSHEFVNARRIINGTDKASSIAAHAYTFLNNMILINDDTQEPSGPGKCKCDCDCSCNK